MSAAAIGSRMRRDTAASSTAIGHHTLVVASASCRPAASVPRPASRADSTGGNVAQPAVEHEDRAANDAERKPRSSQKHERPRHRAPHVHSHGRERTGVASCQRSGGATETESLLRDAAIESRG